MKCPACNTALNLDGVTGHHPNRHDWFIKERGYVCPTCGTETGLNDFARQLAIDIEQFVELSDLSTEDFETLHKAFRVVRSHTGGDIDE